MCSEWRSNGCECVSAENILSEQIGTEQHGVVPCSLKAKHQKLPSDAVHWLDLLTHLGYAPPPHLPNFIVEIQKCTFIAPAPTSMVPDREGQVSKTARNDDKTKALQPEMCTQNQRDGRGRALGTIPYLPSLSIF